MLRTILADCLLADLFFVCLAWVICPPNSVIGLKIQAAHCNHLRQSSYSFLTNQEQPSLGERVFSRAWLQTQTA